MQSMSPSRSQPPLPPQSVKLMQRAVAAHGNGDLERAESAYLELTTRHPDFPDAWHFLGLLHHQRGEGDKALPPLQRAQALDPENVYFLLNFGRILRDRGSLGYALKCMERAHALQPGNASTLLELGEILLTLTRGDEIIPRLESALHEAGEDWRLWTLLGQCRDQAGDRKSALKAFDRAVSLAPGDEINPYLQRAECARRDAQLDLARRDLREALRIAPGNPPACCGMATLAALEGDFRACEQFARRALETNPEHYAAWSLLALKGDDDPGGGFARELEQAATQAGDDIRAWPLHLARGKAWEKLHEYDRAFEAYATAKDALQRLQPYKPEMHVNYTRYLTENLDGAFLERHRAVSARARGQSARPIFICGMPRSGTTLVETILASHPQVNPGGEMRYVHDYFKRTLGNMGLIDTGKWLGWCTTDTLLELAAGWDRALEAAADGRPFVTDKMPSNYLHIPLLHLCFPEAPIVYLKRDARDNCLSCFTTNFSEGHQFTHALDTLASHYRLHETVMDHWRKLLPPGRIVDVSYEALVRDPDAEIRRLLEAVGLPWDPRCLEFHKTRRTVMTASVYQVRQPMYGSSIGRWRHFERHLGPLLKGLEADPPV